MKKAIIAFIAGQAMQLVLLGVGMTITYSTNLLAFCGIIGVLATLMLLIGSVLSSIEMIPPTEEDVTSPIPEGIKVTNTKVERMPTTEPKAEQLFSKRVAK